ncbi:MAG TPA: HEAT repeat domain-containing protein [Conexivisphaerales archaeon]|nr:HEAT repeat domain-containing protein [Conexivisphaerales archaeon]
MDSDHAEKCASSSLRPFATPFSKPHFTPDRPLSLEHIALDVVPNFEDQSFECSATLRLRALAERVNAVTLDLADLKVKSITQKGKGLLLFHSEDGKLTAQLPSSMSNGDVIELVIEYGGKPRKGLYFRKPDKDYPARPVQLWTQGEDEDSHYWFPCIDTPAQKVTSEVYATVPASFTVVSNGRLVDVKEEADGKRKKVHYLQDKPHSVYLISLVAGEYVEIKEEADGVPLFYYVYKGMEEDAKRSFSETPKMVKFYVEKTGMPYPWDKYAQTCVNEYIFGGMENTSATTLTDTTLHDERAHLDFSSVPLVSHELAHMWFGDLLTCRFWKDAWLNEGFATYMEAAYTGFSKGPEEYIFEVLGNRDIYLGELERYARPVVTNVYETASELFDRHLYEKASVVLHMLRCQLGPASFWRGIQLYVKENAFKNVETSDLRAAFEKATGVNLDSFFGQWLGRPGHPDLSMTYEPKGDGSASLRVVQKQPEEAFEFKLKIKVQYPGSSAIHFGDIASKDQSVVIPLEGRPLYVSVDPDFEVLSTVEYSRPREMMLAQILSDTVPGKIQAIKGLIKDASPDAVEALRKAVSSDPFWGVQAEAARALGEIGNDSAMKALIGCLAVENPKARKAVVAALGQFKNAEAAGALELLFQKGDPSYLVEAECLRSIGKTKSADAFDFIVKGMERPSWQEVIKVGGAEGLGSLGDPKAVPVLLDKVKLGNHIRVREAAATALGKVGRDNQEVTDRLTDLLGDYWFRVRGYSASSLAELKVSSAIPALSKAADRELDGRIKRLMREAIIKIRASRTSEEELRRLSDDLDKMKEESRLLRERVDRLEQAGKKEQS